MKKFAYRAVPIVLDVRCGAADHLGDAYSDTDALDAGSGIVLATFHIRSLCSCEAGDQKRDKQPSEENAFSAALRLRAPGAIPRAAWNAARASRLFFPAFPSISTGEKSARSRRTCNSSSVGPTDRADGAWRLAAIEVDMPRRIAALATKHDRILNVKVMAPPGATMSLLLAITLRTTQRKVIRPRSDASVQHRSDPAERWKVVIVFDCTVPNYLEVSPRFAKSCTDFVLASF
jgi:hypothetical protein